MVAGDAARTMLVGLGLAGLLVVGLEHVGAYAADKLSSPKSSLVAQSPLQTQISVNPNIGNDAGGNGSEERPFRTITRALQIAEPNTVIVLAPGTYSAESGEKFPIQLKPGVIIQGDPTTKGRTTIIRGGDFFLSRAFARQNIAVLGADGAAIAGVTITNPNGRGYGLWLESTSPVVADNSFINNTHDGVSVKGNSRALIRNNYFAGNGTNGISVYSNARPELRENLFEKTGFGIAIAQNSAPLVVGNRLVQNTDGIVVNGRAQPILRGNTIEDSSRDGLVAAGESRPDIGTTAQAGGNQFRNNRRYDINTIAIKQTISAIGNQVTRTRLAGRLDLGNGDIFVTQQPIASAPTASNSTQPARPRNPSTSVEIPVPAPRTGASTRGSRRSSRATSRRQRRANRRSRAYRRRFARRVTRRQIARRVTTPPIARRQPIPAPPVARAATSVVIPVPPVSASRQPIPAPPVVRANPVVIPVPPAATRMVVPVNPAPATPPSLRETIPESAPPTIEPIAPRRDRLPDVGVQPGMVPESGARLLMEPDNPPPTIETPDNAVAVRLQYRVLVLIENEQQELLVRELVPNPTVLQIEGRRVLQVGEFSDRIEAEEIMDRMNRNNLSATIEEF